MKLEGKTALVTGAGRGIGREIALAFAREGASVGVNDLTGEGVVETVGDVEGMGREALALPADVSPADGARGIVEAFIQRFGRVDVLVNNAGVFDESPVASMPVETWDRMIRINLRSVFLCTRFILPHMVRSRSGRVINVSSQLAIKGGADLAHYCAAKAGIIGFTKSLALEVAPHNVTVNSIAPGPIETLLTAGSDPAKGQATLARLPLGRYGHPHEVAPTAVLLASDPDGNLYTGQTLGPNSGDVMP
ncbi:MAG: 3-oxoacyl-ACP reductase family protein [Rubrobacteraceae bacterium]